MVLGWIGGESHLSIEELLARKRYARAIKLLRAEFEHGNRGAELRLQMVEALVGSGNGRDAVPILAGLVDEAARRGEAVKAIALLKRIEQLEPGRTDISTRLATLIQHQPTPAPESGSAATASVPQVEPQPEPQVGTSESFAPPENEERPGLTPGPPCTAPPLASPLFSDFTVAELLVLMSGLRLLTYAPGDIILAEGAPGDSMFVLASGSVKAHVRNAEDRYVRVREMHEGDFFGEIALLSDLPRSATIVAASPCELLVLDRASLAGIATSHPRVREVVRRFAAERTGSAEETAARA